MPVNPPATQDAALRGRLEPADPSPGTSDSGVPVSVLKDALSDELPGLTLQSPRLPDKFTHLTDEQYEAVLQILDGFRDNRVVVLDAPTGSGKTIIAETVRQLLGYRGLYVCHSKTLQDQFYSDFPTSGIVKGRSNYLPQRKIKGLTCADCNKSSQGDKPVCSWCPDVANCDYELAKRRALANPIAVINSTYFLTECNGPGRFSKRPFGILDEADTLEQELMRFVEIRISPAMQARLELSPPTKVTKEESWRDWVDESLVRVKTKRINLDPSEQDVQLIRRAKYVENLYNRLQLLADGLENQDWSYHGGKNTQDISFKPVVVDRLGREFLWGHCGKFLVMSASIISASVMLNDLGYDGSYADVRMESQFDVKNRAIRVCPVANMSRAANESAELIEAVGRIASAHPGERILLHTVSYQLADTIISGLVRAGIGRRILTYHSASERDRIVAEFRRTEEAILVAPSLDRGVDFKDEDCRVNVICKVPFPYLGDKQVSKRLYSPGGQTWYNVQTVRTIVQMTGRGTRHREDWSVNYILDKQFGNLWSKCKTLFPQWWKDALDWRYRL